MGSFGKRGHDPALPAAGRAPRALPRDDDILASDDEEPGSPYRRAAILACIAGAVIVALGAGAYSATLWLGKSGLLAKRHEVSRLDARCGVGWTEGKYNGKQLKCYLTTHIDRLCDPQERKHLVYIIDRYVEDSYKWKRSFAVSSLGTLSKLYSRNMELGAKAAALQMEMSKPDQDPARTAELMDDVNEVVEDVMGSPNRMLADGIGEFISEDELIADLGVLLTMGYISESDFGWYDNPLVKKAAETVKPGASACPD